jgi:hypothetical protein
VKILALGEMGMSPQDYYEMTYADFIYKCEGHKRKELNKWRHTRLIVAAIAHKKPRDILELPGDFDHLKGINNIEFPDSFNETLKNIQYGRS